MLLCSCIDSNGNFYSSNSECNTFTRKGPLAAVAQQVKPSPTDERGPNQLVEVSLSSLSPGLISGHRECTGNVFVMARHEAQ